MEKLTLKVVSRDVLGKKTRFLRRQGITPAHLFGQDIDSLSIQCDTVELQKVIAQAGMTKLVNLNMEGEKQAKGVFVKEVQRDEVSRKLLHVDFYLVKKGEKMRVDVPIVFIGEAPALKTKGRMLAHGIDSLHLECLPEKLPSQIEVDISILEEVEQAIHVKDIVLDPEITLHVDPEQLVIKISEAQMKVEEEVVAEEVAEGTPAEGEAKPEAKAEGEAGEKTTG
ncbi:50S ribosomal protein L25 [Chloroflexota bacterium]